MRGPISRPIKINLGEMGSRIRENEWVISSGCSSRLNASICSVIVIGQHDAARAKANGFRLGRDMGDEHGGGGACHARHIVMLGIPNAVIAKAFCGPRGGDAILKALGDAHGGKMAAWGRDVNEDLKN